MDKINPVVRVRRVLAGGGGKEGPGVVSVQHGYLWIGTDEQCFAVVSGKKTLHKIARALLRYAR